MSPRGQILMSLDTYLKVRAAELAARALRDSKDQRRFVAQVRSALADEIEQG